MDACAQWFVSGYSIFACLGADTQESLLPPAHYANYDTNVSFSMLVCGIASFPAPAYDMTLILILTTVWTAPIQVTICLIILLVQVRRRYLAHSRDIPVPLARTDQFHRR